MQYQQKLNLALTRIAFKYPFHAAILNQWGIIQSSIPTMAIGLGEGRFTLFYSGEFVEKLLLAQLEGVLLHEINHILFGHLELNHAKFEDTDALTVAMEVTANEYIQEPLPADAITLVAYPFLPPKENTLERYQRLKGNVRQGATFDDHSLWDGIFQSALGKSIIGSMLMKAGDDLSEEAKEKLPAWLKKIVDKIGQGTASSNENIEIQAKEGHLPWQRVLRSYVGSILEKSPSLSYPPRRFPELIGIFPGWRLHASKPHVMTVIDTSGSMTPQALEQINGELKKMAKVYTVTVVECDAEITAVYPYRTITHVKGRGGTSFIPPLRKKFLATVKPDVVVYFTDGQGDAPDNSPKIPVIWCLCSHGKMPASWGKKITMQG